MKKTLITLICLIFLLTGCANMTDSQKTKTQGTGLGAAGGAAIGALAGQLFGGNTKATVIGAGIGAAVGGGAGYLYGNHVANKKSEYASREAYLNACIASVRQVNNDTRQYNVSLKNEIRGIHNDVNRMIASYKKKKIRRSALQKEKNKVEAKLAQAEEKLKRARDEVAIQRGVMNQEKGKSQRELAKLNKEVARLEGNIAELEQQTDTLASINQRISL